MSYHDWEPESHEGKIGRLIYMQALHNRRGFRYDQIRIYDDAIWLEIFEDIGRNALEAITAPSPAP